ncbi:hypothetical protein ABZ864_29750 [Streptomyces sp. NPDC047082]|uniref:hypothetical protein n=1 Tax=Streptomyces sp. NPDC047082 TaxID=3155259 RepID=UPI0033CB0664
MFQSDDLEGIVRDRAVWSPIYAISGTLDTTLSEIFMPDYAERLDAVKERLRADVYGDADGPAASARVAAHHKRTRWSGEQRGITVKAAEPDKAPAQPSDQFSAPTSPK